MKEQNCVLVSGIR